MELNNQQNSFNRKDFTIGFIYKIQNKINGKVYIGQTIHPNSRPYFHLENPDSTNKRLGSSIKHHGKENFEVKILCECYSKDDLNWAEIFYIVEWYDSIHKSRGYNLRTELQGTHHTQNLTDEEYKAYCDKMKIVQSNPEVNDRRGKSISKTKQTDFWKQNRSPSITDPNYKQKASERQLKANQNPEVRERKSKGQKKSYEENPDRRLKQIENGKKIFKNLTKEQQDNIRELGKLKMLQIKSNPEYVQKGKDKQKEVIQSEEFQIKHKQSHNTESCKRKVREAQIHPIRKFVEEYWFVIKEKFPKEFNTFELMKRFGFDYSDSGFRQAICTGVGTLTEKGILTDNGFFSIDSKRRCKKYFWSL